MGSLTQVQKSIIIGSILGDGGLRCAKGRINALLEINHSLAYKEYVDWKHKQLKELVRTPPKARKNNGKRIAYRFTTLSLSQITTYYVRFYKNKRKVIPKNLNLSPLALAVWFMDDGNKSRSSVYLNTQQFDIESQKNLQQTLQNQWNIDSTLNRDKKYYRIRIRTKDTNKFKKIIKPFVHPIFNYKLV